MLSDKIKRLNITDNLVASHLCNNFLCVKVDHLSFKPQSVNNNRSFCFFQTVCAMDVGLTWKGSPARMLDTSK